MNVCSMPGCQTTAGCQCGTANRSGFTTRIVDPDSYNGNLLTALRATQARAEAAEADNLVLGTAAADLRCIADAAEARVRELEGFLSSLEKQVKDWAEECRVWRVCASTMMEINRTRMES